MKIIICSLLLITALATGGSYYLSQRVDEIATAAVERQGPKTTGTEVSLGQIKSQLLSGNISLQQLIVANPEGFSSPYAFKLDELILETHLPSLLDDVLVIEQLRIEGAHIIAEQLGKSSRTNLQIIAEHSANSDDKGDRPQTADGDTDSDVSSETSPPLKLIVKHFSFSNNQLELVSELLGDQQLSIADFSVDNIGVEQGGISADELTRVLLQQISQQANRAAAKEVENRLKDYLREHGDLFDKIKSLFGGD